MEKLAKNSNIGSGDLRVRVHCRLTGSGERDGGDGADVVVGVLQ